MPQTEAFHARRGRMKTTGSLDLGSIITDDRTELRDKIVKLLEESKPLPILVKLKNTTLDNTFIIDKRFSFHDPNGIIEVIYFKYNEQGSRISGLFHDALTEMNLKRQAKLSEYGWTEKDYYSALYHGIPINLASRAHLEGNLKRLQGFERQVIENIIHDQENFLKGIADRIYNEFGIRVKTYSDKEDEDACQLSDKRRWLRSVYNTIEERKKRDKMNIGKLIDVTSYLNRYCCEEQGRMLHKGGHLSLDIIDDIGYFRAFHPEMLALKMADNNAIYDNEKAENYAVS